MTDETTPVEETLAWEADHRRTASAAGVVAGLVLLIGAAIQTAGLSNAPQVTLLTALRHANTIPQSDLRLPLYTFLSDRAPGLLLGAVLQGGGYAASILLVGYLFRATHARRPALRRWVLIVLLIGLGLLAVSTIMVQIGQATQAHSFAHGHDFSHHAAQRVLNDNSIATAARYLGLLAALASAGGMVMLSLNAMRSGLLTKMLGFLGIISGVAFVLGLGGGLLLLVFSLWLIAVGVMVGGHWPGGVPPAWASGQQEPWPTAAEVRAQRDAARGKGEAPSRPGRGSRAAAPAKPATPVAESLPAGAPTVAPHPSSKKRKRKRR